MTDQCTHCTLKGDYEKCTSTPCSHHEDWIDMQRIARLAESDRKLTACRDALTRCNAEYHSSSLGDKNRRDTAARKLRASLDNIFRIEPEM